MTPHATLWTLTTLGSLVFFVLGWVSHVLRRPTAARDIPDGTVRRQLQDSEQLVAVLEARVLQAQQSLSRAEDQVGQTQGLMDTSAATVRQLGEERERLVAERDSLRRTLDEQERKASDASVRDRRRSLDLEQELERVKLQVQQPRPDPRIAELQRAAAAAAQESQQHKQAALDASTAFREFKGSHDKQLAELRASQSQSLQVESELAAARGEISELTARLQTAQSHTLRIQRDAEQARLQVDRSQASQHLEALSALQRQVEELRISLSAAQAEQTRLRTEAAKAAKAAEVQRLHAGELQARVDTDQARAAELQAARDELVTLRQQELTSADALAQASTLRGQLQEAQVRASQAERRLAELDRQRDELSSVREQLASGQAELEQLSSLQEEARLLRQKVQAMDSKVLAAEQSRKDNEELRDRLHELERYRADASELERVNAEHKQLRLETELLRRRGIELQVVADAHGETLERLDEMTERATEAAHLRERVRILEARLFAIEGALPVDRPAEPAAPRSASSIDTGPMALMGVAGMRTAVLADGAGLLVSGAGEASLHEGLAALSGLVMEFAERVGGLVPVSRIRIIRVLDDNDIVVSCGLLSHAGDNFALAAIGPLSLSQDSMAAAMLLASGSIRSQMVSP